MSPTGNIVSFFLCSGKYILISDNIFPVQYICERSISAERCIGRALVFLALNISGQQKASSSSCWTVEVEEGVHVHLSPSLSFHVAVFLCESSGSFILAVFKLVTCLSLLHSDQKLPAAIPQCVCCYLHVIRAGNQHCLQSVDENLTETFSSSQD